MIDCFEALKAAKRPVLIYGAGIHLAAVEKEAIYLATLLGVPVASTWGARDLMLWDDKLNIGGFGTHGTRAANFAVQNADWILSVGSRLDSKATGTPVESFARGARIFMLDIDQAELNKFGERVTGICLGAREFLQEAITEARVLELPDFGDWLKKTIEWKEKYPACLPEYRKEEGINPYVFIDKLSDVSLFDDIIVSDTGCALAWMMQGFRFKGQRFIHAFNQTPMGYGLPAAIGASFATGKRIVLVTGDGSLQMSIAELATVRKHNLPIKIILFNNQGHAMCRQTEREWMDGEYFSTTNKDLAVPDFVEIARAYGLSTKKLELKSEMEEDLYYMLRDSEPSLLEVVVSPDAEVIPKTKYGHANEDAFPYLSEEELKSNMMIPLYKTNQL
jgi:acetolactate synthase-1/2/3 large subunit